jgi:hypothetical protein
MGGNLFRGGQKTPHGQSLGSFAGVFDPAASLADGPMNKYIDISIIFLLLWEAQGIL